MKQLKKWLMAARSDASGAAFSHELEEVQKGILNAIVRTFLVLGLFATLVGIVKALEEGLLAWAGFYVFVYLVLVGFSLFKHRLSLRVQRGIGFALLYLIGTTVLIRFGLSGAGAWFMLIMCLLATIFFGTRMGIVAVLMALVSFSLAAALIFFEVVPHAYWLQAANPKTWVLAIALFAVFGVVTVLSPGILLSHLSNALRQQRAQSAKLEASNAQMRAEIERRELAECALQENEARLRQIIDLVPHLIFAKDAEGRFILANRATAALYGVSVGELEGRMDADFASKQEEIERFKRDDRDVLTNGKMKVVGEEAIIDSSGTERIFHTVKIPFSTSGNRSAAILGVSVEVTERKQVEQERESLREQLQQAQKMEAVGRLAGGIAHDFNNLLTGILGNISLVLLDLSNDDPMREQLSDIQEASNRAASLTRQLLAFSRKQIIDPKVLDLNRLLESMQRMLPRLIGEDIRIVSKAQPGLWPVMADRSQIEQVIVNLVVNARDAMPNGGRLRIETENVVIKDDYTNVDRQLAPGEYVMIAVSDTGVGMDREMLGCIFEPFFTTKPKDKGTGLGLATAYGTIKQHKGGVEVESELGKGTRFKIYLPRCSGEIARQTPSKAADDLPTGSETILVVEDESIVRSVATRLLMRQGYRVLEAGSGEEALRVVENFDGPIHLLMSDIVMPGMNGRDLAAKLSQRCEGLRILFSSGYTENIIAHEGVLEEGVQFIKKPYSPSALALRVRDVLDARTQ